MIMRNERHAIVVALTRWLGGILLLALSVASAAAETPTLKLEGRWRFALDRADVGVNKNWFNKKLAYEISLPGALQAQGYGDEISAQTPWVLSLYDRSWFARADYQAYTKPGNVKVPFLAQPPRHYLGAAWYQRDVEIPAAWAGKRVVLNLERPHWESTVWLDDKPIGSNNSLVAPHIFDLGGVPPGKHRLTIRVDNRLILPYRPDAHSVSDSLGGSWNGIVGRMELTATDQVWIDDAQVYPNVKKKSVLVKVKIGNSSGKSGAGFISFTETRETMPVNWDANGGAAEVEVQLDSAARTWSEFQPVTRHLTLQLTGNGIAEQRRVDFGLREFAADGAEFKLNGRTIYLRGTHHGGDFPLTGYPPTDVAYWKKIFQINKNWGINHIRFHSFCPPEAAFTAADQLGIYLQPEPGMWNEVSPGTPMEKMLYAETERMIRAYGNHPSFVLLSPSNEPKGRWKEAFDKWIAHYRMADARRLYTNGTGHTEREVPNLAEGTDYLAMQRIGQKMLRGNSAWFGRDYGASLTDVKIPVVAHELGQWVAYPDYSVIKKFTGYLRAGNYEIFRDSLAAHGLADRDEDFAYASGRFQLAAYKEEIEANLRTPGMQGFQLLDLHDYLGQGTALVGLLDAFWEEKNYVGADEFRRFCNSTVPLARLTKRTFTTAESLNVPVEVAHYGEKSLENITAEWKILDAENTTVASGNFFARKIPIGKNIALGNINFDLSQLPAPAQYKLVVSLANTEFANDWNFWLYPSEAQPVVPKDILVTQSWEAAVARLNQGGKVLFVPRNADLSWNSPPLNTLPVFWTRFMNPAWGRMLGLWNDADHPALQGFPTDVNFDWQWTEIVRDVRAVNLDKLPRQLKPISYAIDDWNRNYKLGTIFEAKIGNGKLLVSAFDVINDVERKPVALALRRSLLDYMASRQFQPRVAVTENQMRALFFDTRGMAKLKAMATASANNSDAAKLLDGDPNTYWLAGDGKNIGQHPYTLTLNFPAPVAMTGLILMPRQNHREHEGDIREYVIESSADGKSWREIKRGALVSTFEPQEIRFAQKLTARYLHLTAQSGFGNDKAAALAEIAVIYAGAKLADDTRGNLRYQRNQAASPDIDEGTGARPQPAPKPPRRKP